MNRFFAVLMTLCLIVTMPACSKTNSGDSSERVDNTKYYNEIVGVWREISSSPVVTIEFTSDGRYKETHDNGAQIFTYTGSFDYNQHYLVRTRDKGQLDAGFSEHKITLCNDVFNLHYSNGNVPIFLKQPDISETIGSRHPLFSSITKDTMISFGNNEYLHSSTSCPNWRMPYTDDFGSITVPMSDVIDMILNDMSEYEPALVLSRCKCPECWS